MEQKSQTALILLGLSIVLIACIIGFISVVGSVNKVDALTSDDVKAIVSAEVAKVPVGVSKAELDSAIASIPAPVSTAATTAPVVTDNELLNEFLEGKFSDEFTEIEDNSLIFTDEALEKKDFRVVENFITSILLPGQVLDKSSLEVDVHDYEIEVTKLGLKEDTDKCATVSYELKVQYELEEGVSDTLKKNVAVIYNVCFTEGDFTDEEVTLVSVK